MSKGRMFYGAVLLCALVIALPAVANATTLMVPFFNDSAAAARFNGGPGAADFASWIKIANTSGDTATLTFTYTNFITGADATPTPPANVYLLSDNAGVAFRPYASDAGSEAAGVYVPNSLAPQASVKIVGPTGLSGSLQTLNISTVGSGQQAIVAPQ